MCEQLTQWERVNQWCLALESGLYTQGRYSLRTPLGGEFSYCCLGVACCIYKKFTGKGEWVGESSFSTSTGYESGCLMADVKNWLLGELDRLPNGSELQATLITMNDGGGNTFKDIAAWVRTNVLPLCSKTV